MFAILCSYILKGGILISIELLNDVSAKTVLICESLKNCCITARLTEYKVVKSLVLLLHSDQTACYSR